MHSLFASTWRATLNCAVIAAAVSLPSCTVADQFGDRAVAYNIEAESARDQALLLNIIRAAYRKPMQFSDVSAAVGTATATGTVGSSLLAGPHQSAVSSNLSPGFTFAGGPTFTMNTLDTKEFYAGILAPINNLVISYFASIGVPRQVIYTLLIGGIDIDGRRSVSNSATTQADWDSFQSALNALLDAGLTTELKDPDYFGPELSARSLSDPAKLAALAKENIHLVEERPGNSRKPAVWHAMKGDPTPVFCFDARNPAQTVILRGEIIPIPASARCGYKGKDDSGAPPNALTKKTRLRELAVTMRSTEGVIYFLGEIVRSQLGLDQNNRTPVKPWIAFKGSDGQTVFDTLFSLRPGQQTQSISTTYEGETWSMPVDPSNLNHSAQVLELVTQALALSSSSKDLPSPGVVTLIGH